MLNNYGGTLFMATQTINSNTLSLGMEVNQINLSFPSPEAYKLISDYLVDDLKKAATDGKGLLAFTGKSNDDGSVFLGRSDKLSTYALRFKGPNGMKVFTKFRRDILNNQQHSEIVGEIKANMIQSAYMLVPPSEVNNSKDYINCLNELVQAQQKSTPRLLIEKGRLLIGGRAGANSLAISAETSAVKGITGIVISCKVKEAAAEKVWENLLTVSEATLETCIVYILIDNISRLSSTPFLEHCRNDMLKSYPVGKLSFSSSSKQSNTKAGSYVLRSLTGVFNKLKTASVSQEVQSLLKPWLKSLVEQQGSILNGSSFIQEMALILSSTKPSSDATPPTARRRRATVAKATVASTEPSASADGESSGG